MQNLSSVVAQVHRKSHRSFSSSSPTESLEEDLARVRPYAWMVSRSLGVVIGYAWASYYFGDLVAKHEEGLIEDLREKAKRREKFGSDIGKS